MTISSSRIRFLDKENKILVQDFSELNANIPLTDVDTPFTIEAMDLIEAGYNMLLTFGRDIVGLFDALSDGKISEFLIGTILNSVRLNVPGFPEVGVFVNTLRNTNPEAFGGFVNALIADASNTIFETPSLIVTEGVRIVDNRTQIVNLALSRFAVKMTNGEVTSEYITQLANSGTEDPYQIQTTVNKVLTDYRYAANSQDKFKLPTDTVTANTLVCYLSLTLGYYNYLYSTIKLTDKVTKGAAFATSIHDNTKVYLDHINELKSEVAKSSLDHDSLFYYSEQLSRELCKAAFSSVKSLDYQTQLTLLGKYLLHTQTIVTTSLSYMKSKVGKDGKEMYQEPTAAAFTSSLLSRIKAGTLIYDNTISEPFSVSSRVLFEYNAYLRQALYTQPSVSIQSVTYTLVNARYSVYKLLLEQRGQCTDVQLKTLFGLLELFFQQDIFELEGDYQATTFNFKALGPMIGYEKITTEKFFSVCLKYLQMLEDQFYITYPKADTIGLLSNMVDKITQVKLDLVKNNFYVRNVILNQSSTYGDLQGVMTLDWLQTNFLPITFNTYDSEIYTLYKRDLSHFIFSSESVRTV